MAHITVEADEQAYVKALRAALQHGRDYAEVLLTAREVRSPESPRQFNFCYFERELEEAVPDALLTHEPEGCGCIGFDDFAVLNRIECAWERGWFSVDWPKRYADKIRDETEQCDRLLEPYLERVLAC